MRDSLIKCRGEKSISSSFFFLSPSFFAYSYPKSQASLHWSMCLGLISWSSYQHSFLQVAGNKLLSFFSGAGCASLSLSFFGSQVLSCSSVYNIAQIVFVCSKPYCHCFRTTGSFKMYPHLNTCSKYIYSMASNCHTCCWFTIWRKCSLPSWYSVIALSLDHNIIKP